MDIEGATLMDLGSKFQSPEATPSNRSELIADCMGNLRACFLLKIIFSGALVVSRRTLGD